MFIDNCRQKICGTSVRPLPFVRGEAQQVILWNAGTGTIIKATHLIMKTKNHSIINYPAFLLYFFLVAHDAMFTAFPVSQMCNNDHETANKF